MTVEGEATRQLKDGQVVNRVVGALPKPQLEAQIKPHMKPPTQEAASQ